MTKTYLPTLKVLSTQQAIISAAYLICIGVATLCGESVIPFIYSIAISGSVALALAFLTRGADINKSTDRKGAFLTVSLSWLTLSLSGVCPYIFSGYIPHFVDAFFESASGFTTTGSSILCDIEALPKSILFWRSMTHWIGGIGIIVLVILVMPKMRLGGNHLFSMESSLQEKISPKIKSVGQKLLVIYLTLTFLEILFLTLGGMNLFESVTHAFGTVATGGFSPKNDSVASYSPYIQYVIMTFMFLAAINFSIYYFVVVGGWKKIFRNDELKFYVGATAILGIAITLILFYETDMGLEESFRESFFQVISTISCTGFASADYLRWPQIAFVLIFLMMFLGGSTGSTTGGIKMGRHLVMYKSIIKQFKQLRSPNGVFNISLNGKALDQDSSFSVLTFIILYMVVFVVGTLIVMISGLDVISAASSVATCMAGIGPGFGSVGPANNFAHIPEITKVILPVIMIIGRLEIYTFLILFSKSYWKA
ncbi:MAG: TrkH family potassium uptake protein [Bacteroidales bacterium]